MLTEEAFNRHPRPQAPNVPTYGALVLQKTQSTGISPRNERKGRSELKIDIPSENPKKRRLPSPSPTGPAKSINLTKSPPASPLPVHLKSAKTVVRRVAPAALHNASSLSAPNHTPHAIETLVHTQDGLPWDRVKRLGSIVQGSSELIVCTVKDEPQRLTMVKTLSRRAGGLKEAGQLRKFMHPNVIQMLEVFVDGDEVYIELEYCRFTLEEVVNVHVGLEEPHLRLIAHSIFAAIRYISAHRVIHGNIKLQTTRICGRSMVIKLADFDHATMFEEAMPNSDLEQLGLLLLQCMDGQSTGKHTDVEHVRQQRAVYKVFGLSRPELWSGAKQLMDFLDDLFSESKSATVKVEKPHPYIREDVLSSSLLPYLELVTLESFVLWKEAR